MGPVRSGDVGGQVEPALGQPGGEPGAGPRDRAVPERVELLGGVVRGRDLYEEAKKWRQ